MFVIYIVPCRDEEVEVKKSAKKSEIKYTRQKGIVRKNKNKQGGKEEEKVLNDISSKTISVTDSARLKTKLRKFVSVPETLGSVYIYIRMERRGMSIRKGKRGTEPLCYSSFTSR